MEIIKQLWPRKTALYTLHLGSVNVITSDGRMGLLKHWTMVQRDHTHKKNLLKTLSVATERECTCEGAL